MCIRQHDSFPVIFLGFLTLCEESNGLAWQVDASDEALVRIKDNNTSSEILKNLSLRTEMSM